MKKTFNQIREKLVVPTTLTALLGLALPNYGLGERGREIVHEFQFNGNPAYLTKVDVRAGYDYYCVTDSKGNKLTGRVLDELMTLKFVSDDGKDTISLGVGGFYLNGEELR